MKTNQIVRQGKKFNCIARATVGLLALLSFELSALAGVLVEDFNSNRDYPPCCGAYGTYYSFESNVFQFATNGSVIIGGSATDNGGIYHDEGGLVLWNFTGQTNLLVRAKVRTGNQTTNFAVLFRDANLKSILFSVPFSTLNTTNYTTISKELTGPDWTDATTSVPFDFSQIVSWDIYGEFTDDEQPFRLEVDSLSLTGPTVTGTLQMRYEVVNRTLVLAWPTNLNGGFLLQASPSLPGIWSNQWSITIVGQEYCHAEPITNGNRFYRLLATEETPGQFDSMSEQEYLASVAPPLPDDDNQMQGSRGSGSSGGGGSISPPESAASFSRPSTTSYIDVSSYTSDTSNYRFFFWPGMVIDFDESYHIEYNSHSGGSDAFTFLQYTNHVSTNGTPGGQVRVDAGHDTYTYATTWATGTTNWPGGVRTPAGYTQLTGSAGAAQNVSVPEFTYTRILGLTNIHVPEYSYNWMVAFTGAVTRVDNTTIDLHTGVHPSNYWFKFVLLDVAASKVDDLSVSIYDSIWPDQMDGTVAPLLNTPALSWSNISVLGEQLNADGCIFKKLAPSSTYNATPQVTGADNYFYWVQVPDHQLVNLSRSYHPLFDVPPFSPQPYVPPPALTNLQEHYNNVSVMLGTDDDTKIPDSDPSAAQSSDPNSVYRSDDAPTYLEFLLFNGPSITNVLTRRLSPVFPAQYKARKFYRITFEADAITLLQWTGANVKQVKSIVYGGSAKDGLANQPSSPASILLLHTPSGVAGPHEWCHTIGIDHRGLTSNPGPLAQALMNPTNYANGGKVNRYERGVIRGH